MVNWWQKPLLQKDKGRGGMERRLLRGLCVLGALGATSCAHNTADSSAFLEPGADLLKPPLEVASLSLETAEANIRGGGAGEWPPHSPQKGSAPTFVADKTNGESFSLPEEAELALTDLIQQALDSSPDVESALERLRIADAALAGAQAEFFPRLSFSNRYGISDNPVQAFMFQLNQARFGLDRDLNDPVITDGFHSQLAAHYTIYAGGRQSAEKRAAAAKREAAVSGLEGVQNYLIFQVAKAYYRLLQAQELFKVRQQAIAQVERHLALAQARLRAGTAVRSDLLAVEVRLAEAQEALIAAQNRLELAWLVLDNVVGVPVERRELPATIPAAPWSEQAGELETMVAEAIHGRPEIGRLSQRREAASAQVRAARAAQYPTVDLTAHYDAFAPGGIYRGNTSFFVGLVAQLSLFDGGRARSQIDQAQARLQELNVEQKRLLADIQLDVRRAYLQLQEARQRLGVATEAVGQAEESLREIESRYRAQIALVTELIDAQVALSNGRARRANAQAEVEIARSDLQRALGRLNKAVVP